MSDVVIGVDPSSKAMHAVVTRDDDPPFLSSQILHKNDKPLAAAQSYDWMRQLLAKYPLDDVYVFVEIPVMGRAGAHTMMVIAKVVGAVEAAGVHGGAKVTEVNNQTWKKRVVGKGNCGKPEIKEWCKIAWPVVYAEADGNQDLMDASAINRYGQSVLGLRIHREQAAPKKTVRRKKVQKRV